MRHLLVLSLALLLPTTHAIAVDTTAAQPQLYVRWTNTGTGEPYCLWTFVQRNAQPYNVYAGMLNATGFNRSMSVPADHSQWIGPGQSTPWCNLTPFLLPKGPFNRVQMVASRQSPTVGLVDSSIQGTLEFAFDDKKVIQTVTFRQDAPRLRLAVPGDFSRLPIKIQTGYDALQSERNALPPGIRPQAPARYLDLTTFLNLDRGLDDPALIEGEFTNLTRMGFNGTTYVLHDAAHPEATADYYRAHGMPIRFGIHGAGGFIWGLGMPERDVTRPDLEKIDRAFQATATRYAAVLPETVRIILMDEPAGPALEKLAASQSARRKFREYLQAQKVAPADLGATDWSQVVPVTTEEKDANPALFYYSGLFRLQVVADYAGTLVAEKKKFLPDNIKAYVDYSPPFSWAERGADPFLMQRNGGLEMGWSEDWLGYNASPEYTADTYALLRAAGPGQPLGGYMVGKGGNPLLQRLKYYTLVAGGARQISVYNYGPSYAGVDSWSERYDLYPLIRDVQFELGRIDEALNGTTRRPAQIALLYNRTAAIWSGSDSTAEQDARFLRWALAHAGYDADIIPEEDVVAGRLDHYKVLYLDGIQLRRDAAQKIAGWVQNGGVLLGGAGAATRDEFNRPQSTLEAVFGAKSVNLQMVSKAGRPKYELRTQHVLDTLRTGDAERPLQFDQLCYRETLQPAADARVLFTDAAGAVLGTQHKVGQGVAIRLAALPGLAYINRAIRDTSYDADSYLPRNYDPALRHFLSLPARLARVEPVAESNLDSAEIVRYDAPGCSVIFVINYAGEEKKGFSMLLPDAGWARRAYTADGAPATLQREASGALRVSFPLNAAGAVVLEK